MACGGGAEASKRDSGGRGEWRGQDLFAWLLLRDGYTAQPSFPKSNATQLEDLIRPLRYAPNPWSPDSQYWVGLQPGVY